jgi:hypothetical protein
LRGLFEPVGTWSISENSQTFITQSGIESRPFLFTPEVSGKSAANDGGLIEVRIFRAKGRKRRAPGLETFRPQEQYGIRCVIHGIARAYGGSLEKMLIFRSLPSAGLLDKPQDTRFYDYILVDPKDEPYAAFLFHYRSWEFLQSLQLIPSSHPRALLKPSNSVAFLAGPSTDKERQEEDEAELFDSNDEDYYEISHQESPPRTTHISQLRNSKVVDVAHDRPGHRGGHDEAFKSRSRSPEQRNIRAGVPISAFSVPQTTLDEWAFERPLPRRPRAKSSFDHSRNSSTSSNAPSVTPSLLPWLDRDSDNPSPEPIIGVAITVPVLRSMALPDDSLIDGSSYSSAEWSIETLPQPTQTRRPMSNSFVIPPEALFPPSNSTVPKSKRESSHSILAQGRLIIEHSDSEDENPEAEDGSASPPPSEAEWLSRQQGLSPIKRDSKQNEVATRWSFASSDTVDKSDYFLHDRGNHMTWAPNRNHYQHADSKNTEDKHSHGPQILEYLAPGSDDKAHYGKPAWI